MRGLVVTDHTHRLEAEVAFKPPKVGKVLLSLERNDEEIRRFHVWAFYEEKGSCG